MSKKDFVYAANERANPYLFILLKRLIEKEAEIFLSKEKPSNSEIARFIVDVKSDRLDKHLVKTLRVLWGSNDFTVPRYHLDLMATVPKSFIRYSSWDDYWRSEHSLSFATFSDVFTDIYQRLSFSQRQIVNAMVERRLSDIVLNSKVWHASYLNIVLNIIERMKVSKLNKIRTLVNLMGPESLTEVGYKVSSNFLYFGIYSNKFVAHRDALVNGQKARPADEDFFKKLNI